MQDAQNLNEMEAHAVDDDEGRAGNDEFACIAQAAGAAEGGVFLEIRDRLQDPLSQLGGGTRIILCDEVAGSVEVAERARRPSKLHAYPSV